MARASGPGDEVLGLVAGLEHHRRVERPDERVTGQLLVASDVHEAVGLVAEVVGERAHHRRLGDAGEADEQDRLAALEGA